MGSTIIPFYDGMGFVKVIEEGVYSPDDADLRIVEKAIEGRYEDGEFVDYFTVNDFEVYIQGDYADALDAVRRVLERGELIR